MRTITIISQAPKQSTFEVLRIDSATAIFLLGVLFTEFPARVDKGIENISLCVLEYSANLSRVYEFYTNGTLQAI